jgi:DNA-binding transcriptional ArsR family regulator
MRIFEAVRSSGGCSIKDLADVLDSSTTALYYHLDLLMRAGMIDSTVPDQSASGAARGGRRPATFTARGERIIVEYDPANGRDRRRIATISRTWLDEGQSEVQTDANHSERTDPFAPLGASSTTAWEALNEDEVMEVRTYLERVEAVIAGARARRDRTPGSVHRASHHIAFTLVPSRNHTLPSPALRVRAVETLDHSVSD